MELTQEHLEFERMLEEKRHKEIIEILSDMLKELSMEQKDPEVVIDTSAMEKAVKELSNTSSAVPASIKAIGDVIVKKLNSIEENNKRETKWVFDINRNKNGQINKIIAKAN